jgi:hypothetical protein
MMAETENTTLKKNVEFATITPFGAFCFCMMQQTGLPDYFLLFLVLGEEEFRPWQKARVLLVTSPSR